MAQAQDGAVIKIMGIVLIVAGLAGLAWGGFSFSTSKKIVDIGPIEATQKETHRIPPIVSGVVFLGGIVLLIAGRK